MKAMRASCAAALLALLLGGPLAAQGIRLTGEQSLVDAGGLNPFARGRLGAFTVAALDNGIPVVIMRNTANRVCSLKAVLCGGVSFTPVSKAGLEAVTLSLLTKGSERYSYAEVQKALFEKSSAIVPNAGSFDMTSLDLFTLDEYFDEMLPLFADAFLHPRWNAEEFPRVMDAFKLAQKQAETDPFSLAVRLMEERLFAGHPYEASWAGAGYSLENISLDDIKDYYRKTFVSGRVFLVAVGSFDQKKLVKSLNAGFGAMPRGELPRPPVPSLASAVKPDLIVETSNLSTGVAYVQGDFALPPVDSPEYPALMVAFGLLDDVLFEILRTQNGACYGAWSAANGYTASYGELVVYKTAVPARVKRLVDQAIGVIASGRCLSGRVSASAQGKSGIGGGAAAKASGSFVAIAEALPFYKTQFLTRFYSGQQTNISVASQIASSIFYHGDYRDYLFVIDRIQAVTPDQVVRVARKYLRDAPLLWIALGDPAVLKDINREDFLRYTGD